MMYRQCIGQSRCVHTMAQPSPQICEAQVYQPICVYNDCLLQKSLVGFIHTWNDIAMLHRNRLPRSNETQVYPWNKEHIYIFLIPWVYQLVLLFNGCLRHHLMFESYDLTLGLITPCYNANA